MTTRTEPACQRIKKNFLPVSIFAFNFGRVIDEFVEIEGITQVEEIMIHFDFVTLSCRREK